MSCSFKGFSERFQIDDFDLPHVGLNRLEQGNLIHAILETFFNEITSNISLLNLSENELDKLIKKHIEYALEELPRDNFKFNEKIRLVTIIHNYLELEKQRSGFEILETESTSEVNINGLKFSTRIDRMDQLEDGSKLIIDYKTGNGIKISQMIGDPIEQAQLPIYAISNSVDNVAFATINANNCQFNSINKNKSEWVKQINEWTLSLNTSSLNFQNGIADVLPTKNACDFCEYDLLCRVDKTSNN
jgi:RecB family exonuclease